MIALAAATAGAIAAMAPGAPACVDVAALPTRSQWIEASSLAEVRRLALSAPASSVIHLRAGIYDEFLNLNGVDRSGDAGVTILLGAAVIQGASPQVRLMDARGLSLQGGVIGGQPGADPARIYRATDIRGDAQFCWSGVSFVGSVDRPLGIGISTYNLTGHVKFRDVAMSLPALADLIQLGSNVSGRVPYENRGGFEIDGWVARVSGGKPPSGCTLVDGRITPGTRFAGKDAARRAACTAAGGQWYTAADIPHVDAMQIFAPLALVRVRNFDVRGGYHEGIVTFNGAWGSPQRIEIEHGRLDIQFGSQLYARVQTERGILPPAGGMSGFVRGVEVNGRYWGERGDLSTIVVGEGVTACGNTTRGTISTASTPLAFEACK